MIHQMKYWILVDRKPEPATREEWHRFCDTTDRTVAREQIGGTTVSTVFDGIQYHETECPAVFFETMAYGDGVFTVFRCETWEQAVEQHQMTVDLIEATKA